MLDNSSFSAPPPPPDNYCTVPKSEILLLGISFPAPPNLNHTPFKDLKIKISVKILGVYFTYDRRLRRKLNFDEITKTVKDKLRIWKWRDLTIIGRIQLVKTFIILTFLYRASLICMDKEFVNEVNKIIFDFIWKGKDKVKRRVLVGDITGTAEGEGLVGL